MKSKKEFLDGVRNLEKLGLKIVNRKLLTQLPSTRSKVDQIHKAFSNRNIQMILARRGGYSAIKLLPHLDFNLIKKNPKTFAGFSDLSALLNPIFERTHLVTLHSPMIINFSNPSKFTVKSFLNALQGFPDRNLFAGAPVKIYGPGLGRGRLKGGNLATLTSLIGTQWEMDTAGTILFLEDVDEKLYEIDRRLTQWILGGKLRKVRGLILGDFKGIRNREVYRILSDQMEIRFPVVHSPYIGHGRNKITLPVGARVELNTALRALIVQ